MVLCLLEPYMYIKMFVFSLIPFFLFLGAFFFYSSVNDLRLTAIYCVLFSFALCFFCQVSKNKCLLYHSIALSLLTFISFKTIVIFNSIQDFMLFKCVYGFLLLSSVFFPPMLLIELFSPCFFYLSLSSTFFFFRIFSTTFY